MKYDGTPPTISGTEILSTFQELRTRLSNNLYKGTRISTDYETFYLSTYSKSILERFDAIIQRLKSVIFAVDYFFGGVEIEISTGAITKEQEIEMIMTSEMVNGFRSCLDILTLVVWTYLQLEPDAKTGITYKDTQKKIENKSKTLAGYLLQLSGFWKDSPASKFRTLDHHLGTVEQKLFVKKSLRPAPPYMGISGKLAVTIFGLRRVEPIDYENVRQDVYKGLKLLLKVSNSIVEEIISDSQKTFPIQI